MKESIVAVYLLFAIACMCIMMKSDAGKGRTPMSMDNVIIGSLFISLVPVLQQIVVFGYMIDRINNTKTQ